MRRAHIDLTVACDGCAVPVRPAFIRWCKAALADTEGSVRVGLRIVAESEAAELNTRFRGRTGPTNVLSFPYDDAPLGKIRFLGDIVICAPLVKAEALKAGRPENDHWAHLVIHGILHLQGFDHETDQDARVMEERETRILTGMGFTDPYQ